MKTSTYIAQNTIEAEYVVNAIKQKCYFAGRIGGGVEVDTNAPDHIVSEAVRDYMMDKFSSR